MRIMRNTRACVPLLLAAAVACTPQAGSEEAREPAPADGAAVRAAAAASATRMLPPEVIDSLEQEYAVLRRTPAPEPRPSPGATPEEIPGRVKEAMPQRSLQTVTGEATFYANHFEGRRTASGIRFRQNQMVAAHRGFPFGTLLRVTNVANDRAVNVRVVDRGPFGSHAAKRNTIIDLSRRAAETLGYVEAGRAEVRVEVLEWGDGLPLSG